MRPALPALSYHFGLRWADIEDMPYAEIDAYLGALRDIGKG